MPLLRYSDTRLRRDTLAIVDKVNMVVDEYIATGFRLTLRQLYYQFVIRDIFPEDRRWRWTGSRWVRDANGTKNAPPNYKWLGSIVSDGRMAGLIDWDAFEDRVRNLQAVATWESPEEVITVCARQFRLDLWRNQRNYVEVWIEKEALIGVVAQPSRKWRVPYFACKGYTSQSGLWDAGYNRLRHIAAQGRDVTILYLGDHDPSGVDMTRDISVRLGVFCGYSANVDVVRIALNLNQIEEYGIPPDPAKKTDSRFLAYNDVYGDGSWELDALSPEVIAQLIEQEIESRVDMGLWAQLQEQEDRQKEELELIARRYDDVAAFVRDTEV